MRMASGFGEPSRASSSSPAGPSCTGNNNYSNDGGGFECNICFDMAAEPVITLCGHLYCWPCLHRWLHHHSHSHECPVCKAIVQQENLVPLYGRGKTQTDPRNKCYPGMEIPHRPHSAPPHPPEANYGFGNYFTVSTAFGRFIPSLLNMQFHGFQDATVYGTMSGYPFGVNVFSHDGDVLKNLLFLIGVLLLLAIIFLW